jgi:hypothetical protein
MIRYSRKYGPGSACSNCITAGCCLLLIITLLITLPSCFEENKYDEDLSEDEHVIAKGNVDLNQSVYSDILDRPVPYSISGSLDLGTSAPDLKELIDTLTTEELARLPAYTMECGTEDILVYLSNEDYDSFLTEKGVEHTYIARTGAHDWTFWMECLPKVLRAVSQQFE